MDTLKGKKILVTGSSGFIGSYIVKELINQGSIPVLYDLKNGCDILDVVQLEKVMDEGVDGVIHQAALVSVPESLKNPDLYFKNNVLGTENVLKIAYKVGIKRVILASSSAVEGLTSPYGVSKAINEAQAETFNLYTDMEVIGLRYYNVYGYGQNPQGGAIIPSIINKLLNKERVIIYGDGSQTRDFIHVQDVAFANLKALTIPFTLESFLYPIASGESVTINDLFHLIVECLGIKDFKLEYALEREGDIKHSIARELEETLNYLGWKQQITLKEGIINTCEGFKHERLNS